MTFIYDTVVIGAGMSGLAAGIRLAMFDKKVLLLESHYLPGGLNSYYQRGKRSFDVGLHALTNYSIKGKKKNPLLKVLRQLRIPYDDLILRPQRYSKIVFDQDALKFSNDIELLIYEIGLLFPRQKDNFVRLVKFVQQYSDDDLYNEKISAKEQIRNFITDERLIEMILAPLLIYGSAWENDMDCSQFIIMFRSIYLEGFSRPQGGVRSIIEILLDRYKREGGELNFKSEVTNLEQDNNTGIWTLNIKNNSSIRAKQVISSIGHRETLSLVNDLKSDENRLPGVGKLSFTETIFVTESKVPDDVEDCTILFYNERKDNYLYQKPNDFIDRKSAVICFPDNFTQCQQDNGLLEGEGIVRLTHMANYDIWKKFTRKEYQVKKEDVSSEALRLLIGLYPSFSEKISFQDVFTPMTINRYTGHLGGAVYGSPDKNKFGKTPWDNLYLCGTDQGFLGIVGSLLSGLTMVNFYSL